MGMRAPQAQIKRHLNRMAKKYVGVEFRVIYASNGETAILPVNPITGELQCASDSQMLSWSNLASLRYGTDEHRRAYNALVSEACS